MIGLATLLVAQGIRPAEPVRIKLLTAAAAMPAGHIVADRDVTVADWPGDMRPPNAFESPDAVVGRMTIGAVDAGEPLGPSRILAPSVLDKAVSEGVAETGLVAVSVRLADGSEARLLRTGDVIDILAARSSGLGDDGPTGGRPAAAETVATRARVLVVPAIEGGDAESVLGGGGVGEQDGSVLVVAVTSETASRLAGAAAGSRLSTVLRPSVDATAGQP